MHRDPPEESAALARAERVRALGAEPLIAVETIVAALDDPDALVRGSAVIALLDAEPGQVLGALEAAWADGTIRSGDGIHETEARILEYELIARVPMKHTLPSTGQDVCAAALAESEPLIRSRGVDACVRAGEPGAVWLQAMAHDSAWTVRTRLASALAGSGHDDPARRALLRQLAMDEHPTVRHAAGRAHLSDPS